MVHSRGLHLEYSKAIAYIKAAGVPDEQDVLGYIKCKRSDGARRGHIWIYTYNDIVSRLRLLGVVKLPPILPYLTEWQAKRHQHELDG